MGPRSRTLVACLLAAAFAVWLLWPVVASFGSGAWIPEGAWRHRDFLGGYWLFLRSAQVDHPTAALFWPDGGGALVHDIPNPFDAWLLAPVVRRVPFPLWWNGLQLGTFVLNVAAATWLARSAGCGLMASVAAGAAVAASPVMLHEVAGGRTLSGVVWPGLVGLGLHLRGRSAAGGLLIGLQGWCYVYTGLACGVAALALRPSPGLLTAVVVVAPSLVWSASAALRPGHAPDAGYTTLPVAGLLGLDAVPERFRLLPGLWLAALAPLVTRLAPGRRWGWLLAVALGLVLAVGPVVRWQVGAPPRDTPLTWLWSHVPGLWRMHHPVRTSLVVVPLLAALAGGALERVHRLAPLLLLLGCALARGPVLRATAWDQPPHPPGLEAARWLAGHGTAVVDLAGARGEALALQPWHALPVLEGLRPEAPANSRALGLRRDADRWLRGERVAGLAQRLVASGYSHVLLVDRGQGVTPAAEAALTADLGPPVVPGVWSLRPR